MKKYLTKEMRKRILLMLVGVFFMGVGVQFLNRTNLGPDPFSAMNYGFAAMFGISFGTFQLLFNAVLFLIVLLKDRTLFGLGTIGNMVIVGYSADFTGWVVDKLGFFPTADEMTIGIKIGIMIPTLILFLFAAALYMNCGLGTSPYDALPLLLHRGIEKAAKKQIPYKFVRMLYDGIATVVALLVGGTVGVVTVLMVFTLGPCVDFVSGLVKKSGIFETK
ncbi:MAG: hypothetical protein J6K15_10330 [Lachnospiraceae bacterium]|nr:hypothetical protein [Lachnospiraceae bacterium]